ncbi:MAG: hypothetical protein JWO38_4107 [Gemmataceae bacterium]|nr:hypothetical protein [Gemmataceae bacterium]
MSLTTDPHTSANGDLVNRVQQLRLNDQLGAGTARRGGGSWLPWVLCGLLALTWAGVGVRSYRTASVDRPDDGVTPAAQTTRPSGSASGGAPAPTAPGEILLQLKGNLIPSLQIAVSPDDVGARVTKISFWEGKLVQEGEVLAWLVDSQYANRYKTEEASVLSAVAKIDKAKAGVASAEAGQLKAKADIKNWQAQITLAEAELRRAKLAEGLSAEARTAVDKALSTLDVSKAQLEAARATETSTDTQKVASEAELGAAKAECAAAKARRDEAKRLFESCQIKAPITGTVLTKKADKGSLINPLAFSSTNGGSSGSLCEIADLSKMEVEVDVPERQITKVDVPQRRFDCQIVADANPERVYRGYVDRVMPIADDSKNVVKVRVRVVLPKVEKPGSFLKPKMSVVVTAYNRDFAQRSDDQVLE